MWGLDAQSLHVFLIFNYHVLYPSFKVQYFQSTKCLSCMKYRAPMSSHPAITLKHSPRSLNGSLRLSAFVKATSSKCFENFFTLFSSSYPKGTIFNLLHHCSTSCNVSVLSSVDEISFSADVQMSAESSYLSCCHLTNCIFAAVKNMSDVMWPDSDPCPLQPSPLHFPYQWRVIPSLNSLYS